MSKFAVFFTLEPEAIAGMMERPSDRETTVRHLMESAGARLEAYYWMFGAYDGFVIGEAPDSASVAAVSLAVSSTGAFGHLETHELIPASQINDVLARAKQARGAYTAPGA